MITNYLSPLEFRILVQRLPNVSFFTQRVSIPDISASGIDQATPLNRIYQQPNSLTYSTLDLNFILDEEMNNYLEMFNWLKGITSPENYEQFNRQKDSEFGLYSDITVTILNSHKNPKIEFTYKNCFPISLSSVQMDTTQPDITYPEATTTFQYDYFDVNILK